MKQSFFIFPICLILLMTSCDSTSDSNNKGTTQETTKEESIDEQILDDPSNPKLYEQRGRRFLAQGNMIEALKDFDRGLQADPQNESLFLFKGETLFQQQTFKESFDTYQACIERNPESIPCLLKCAEMNVHLRQYEDAIKQVNKALSVDEKYAEAYYIKGRIYKEIGDSSLAVSSYQTATEVDPNYYDAYLEAGLLYSQARSDVAMEFYNSAIDLKPNSVEAIYAMAYHLQITGVSDTSRWTQADGYYQRILEIDPSNSLAHYNQGFIDLEYRSEYRDAIQHFNRAIELYPAYYQAYYNRGLCHESLNEKDLALADYDQALTIESTFTSAALAKSRVIGQ
ncbi:MAG: tetratricopeptide repeat protein [Flavobacteriales bacterium]|nr:tetratricopeptide repeat protein [Flavobacteriales bacterium]